ncbi:MAG: GNAT family N-acetyltransferase [Streptomycetaceae bacterium]|nr:GNAT family N-acetyltransferase [Streptomycetaceae bacterium]
MTADAAASSTAPHDAYELRAEIPSVATYRMLRPGSGLSEKSLEAAERGLPGTWYAVTVYLGDAPVGMGRIIGDGGLFFQVVDICVLPEHQRRGLGKRIMRALSDEIARRVPESAHVSLIADGDAKFLYEQYGFVETAPGGVGMAYVVGGTREDV